MDVAEKNSESDGDGEMKGYNYWYHDMNDLVLRKWLRLSQRNVNN